jgi:L-asparaginase
MKNKLPIGIIFAGGTTILTKDRNFSVDSLKAAESWTQEIPEIKIISTVKNIFAYPERNQVTETEKWQKICELITNNLDSCQGFVVSYPLENIEYAACALSFSLWDLSKPVLLTGNFSDPFLNSFKKFTDLEIKSNFINSSQLATLNLPEVAIVFGNKIIKATRSIYNPQNLFNPFDQIDNKPLGKIDLEISLNHSFPKNYQNSVESQKFENKILTIEIHPGTCLASLENIINHTYQGIIFKIQNFNQVPQDQLQSIIKLSQKNQVATIFYLPLSEKIEPNLPSEIIAINNMTFPATFTKLSWALGQTKELSKIKLIFQKNYSGEIISN